MVPLEDRPVQIPRGMRRNPAQVRLGIGQQESDGHRSFLAFGQDVQRPQTTTRIRKEDAARF
jgi:hypothetical protein